MKSYNTKQQQQYSSAYDDSQAPLTNFKGRRARPKRLDIFFHLKKTVKLIGALITDWRIPLWRKALFFGSMGALLLILLFPDALGEAFMSTVLPLAGTVLGIPIDAGFDWVAFAMAVVSLLRFFPADLVTEHYRQVFQK